MDYHAGGFVEHDEVIIFEKYFQREILGGVIEGHCFRKHDGDPVADLHRVARLGRVAIDLDVLLADEGLDARAGQVGKAGR